jgi:hypothetical protein
MRDKDYGSYTPPSEQQSGQPQQSDQQEATSGEESRKRFIERMRAFAESDPKLFAARAVNAIESLLTVNIPDAERTEKARAQELVSHMHALGGLNALTEKPNAQWWSDACRRSDSAGFVAGLTSAFNTFEVGISGKPLPVTQAESKNQSQTGSQAAKK